jgi:hypothetical protein
MNQFLWGALAMSGWLAGLFFLKFWRVSGDRLFMFFFLAFSMLALNWLGLALVPSVAETRHQVFILRLLAFVLIIVGVVDKNRRSRPLGARSAGRRRS